jgi:hypothetical protein
VRTVIESYKTRPYTGKPIKSRSLDHWSKYLSSPWSQAWKEFLQLIQNYMRTYQCAQAIKTIYATHGMGGLDAPDFFSSALKWSKTDMSKVQNQFDPIIIITTEQEASKLKDIITGPEFNFGAKIPPSDQLPNGTIGTIYKVKLDRVCLLEQSSNSNKAVYQLDPRVQIIRYTELDPLDPGLDKTTCVFVKDLVQQTDQIPLIKTFSDLGEKINQLVRTVPKTNNSTCSTVFKVDYFDPDFVPPQSDMDGYAKILDLATTISFGSKFENSIKPVHQELKNVKWNQLIPRNPNLVDQIVANISDLYTSGGAKLAIFVTGIPGLGKDWVSNSCAKILVQIFPELENKVKVINQDMFECDANKYAQGLIKCVQTNTIVFITRNGPGSARSIEICESAQMNIHLIMPRDPQILLLAGCVQYSLTRAHEDITQTHVLSSLPDEKIISIVANFFGALGAANGSIYRKNKSGSSNSYLGIGISSPNTESGHLTLEFGIIGSKNLVGIQTQVLGTKNVSISKSLPLAKSYGIDFELADVSKDLSNLIDSRVPHITRKVYGEAKPVHSGWWGWVVNKFFPDKFGLEKFGSWEILIDPNNQVYQGEIKLF